MQLASEMLFEATKRGNNSPHKKMPASATCLTSTALHVARLALTMLTTLCHSSRAQHKDCHKSDTLACVRHSCLSRGNVHAMLIVSCVRNSCPLCANRISQGHVYKQRLGLLRIFSGSPHSFCTRCCQHNANTQAKARWLLSQGVYKLWLLPEQQRARSSRLCRQDCKQAMQLASEMLFEATKRGNNSPHRKCLQLQPA